MIEIIAGKNGVLGDDTIARVLTELYDEGLMPDWWKLEPQASEKAWAAIDAVIFARDPLCRGVLLLGLEASVEALREGFAVARTSKSVRGFAVGRTIWVDAGKRWLAGEIDDETAVKDMARRFRTLCEAWDAVGDTVAA